MLGHYKILGLQKDASPEQIREALELVRSKMASYAPGIEISDELVSQTHREEWQAFHVLSEPSSRQAYDALITPPEPAHVEPEPVAPVSFMTTFISYAAFAGLVCAVIMFLAILAKYLI